ncbi:MAG TPA: hypothetical protein VGO63_03325 [Candidatus Paceibacterota bacterium]|jgi:hypothetical protein|nr:hypothetical protein [Candidatus Paceibacterota bacterium]
MNTKIILSVLTIIFVIGACAVVIKSSGQNAGAVLPSPEIPLIPVEASPELSEPIKPTENPSNNSLQFGQAVTLKVDENITFSDGLKVTLKKIDDSRCPKDVQCIWTGELAGTFSLSGGKMVGEKEIRIGSLTGKGYSIDGYMFSLESAMADSMTIIVSLK